MNRRDIILSVVSGTTLALAGCTSDDSDSPNGGSPTKSPESEGDLDVTRVTQDDVRTTVKDVFTASSLSDDNDHVTLESGSRLLLVHAQVRNNADDEKTIPEHGDFSVRDADNIRQNQVTDEGSKLSEPVGKAYTPATGFGGDAKIEPGAQVRGWLAYSVSDDKNKFTIELPDLLTEDGKTVAWDVTVPEATGTVFEESIERPTDPRSGQSTQLTVTVANAGIRTGRVKRNYHVHKYLDDGMSASIEGGISGGEQKQTTLEFTPGKIGQYAIKSHLGAYDPISVTAREFNYGETWDLVTGLSITVSNPVLTDTITYNSSEGEGLEATPNSGNKFLVFEFEAESTDEHYWEPMFVATSGDQSINTFDDNRPSHLLEGYDQKPVSPETPEITGIGGVKSWPHEYGGGMIMEVPESFSMSDLMIRLQDQDTNDVDRYAAIWK